MFKEYQCVMQEGNKDCGACALLTIIKTYGGNVSLEYLKDLTRTTKDGTNAYLIMNAAKEMGLDSKAVRGSIFDLEDNMFPCIAHVIINKNMGHFIVIHKLDRNKKILTIADPAVGRRLMSYTEFLEITTNQFILFTPTKKIPILETKNKLKESIFFICRNNMNVLISIFIFSLICTIINIITSYKLQFIIDNVISYNSDKNLNLIISIILFLTIIKIINNFIRNNLLNYINHELDHILIKDIFKHIISLPYLYYKNRTTGEIISRINDLCEIRDTISKLFITVFVDILLVIFVFITLLSINKKLTLISVLIALSYMIVLFIFNKIIKKYIKTLKEDNAIINSYLHETISSIDVIKGLSLEEKINNNFEKKYNKYLNNSFNFNRIYNIENLFKDIIDYLGIIIIILIGTKLVLESKMTLSQLITYSSLIVFFLEPIKNILDFDIDIKKVKETIKRVNDLYSIKKEELEFNEKYTNKEFKGNIKIKDLSYSYNTKNNILDKVKLNIKKGEKLLITGSSGSGKSTLVKILMKYLNIENNQVEIDDKDLNYYNVKELREKISYVSQNEILYNDTIYNNVTINRYIDYDEFLNICKITKVDEIMNKTPFNSSFLIEENGFNISGGERQRIMLARALVKDAEIYIFDESLSQIDVTKEREILKDLFKKYKNKTFIIISHRFDNSDLYDRKIQLKSGKLID
ncbi:MAG: peptidase domain-containing ABC transporter [Firmicutes bacterium]|nr:peptidase domain-containing ABC transporter [Bacillota bacterium]